MNRRGAVIYAVCCGVAAAALIALAPWKSYRPRSVRAPTVAAQPQVARTRPTLPAEEWCLGRHDCLGPHDCVMAKHE
jgi:hypothetical protein